MVPPKYTFFVGKYRNYVRLYEGYEYSPSTGELVVNKQCTSTDFIYVDDFMISTGVITDTIRISSYDKDGNRLNRIGANKSETIKFGAGVYKIGITFYNTPSGLSESNILIDTTEVNPHYKELNKKYAKESGQEFFRISLDGKINLFGQDYELINNSSLEDQLIFIIHKYNRTSNKWVEYYKGEFNKTDCKFDHDKKKCELKTTAIDKYNEIINKYENTYDLIKLAPAITHISMHKRSLMQVYIRGANSISNFFGGIYWESDVNEAIDNHDDLINKYYFSYIKTANEFYIRNASISGVNGVYAGTNGYWSKWDPGHTCQMELVDGSSTMYWIRLYRNSDNVLLYQSEKKWHVVGGPDNKYILRDDIKMVNVNNSSDTFTIESPFVYHIYRRLLCDVDTVEDSEGIKNTYDLPSDDFVTDNRNYKKCIGLTGGMFFCTSRAVDKPTRYGLNDYGQYFTNEFIPGSTGIGRPLPISRNSWANASLWYVYDSYYSLFEERLRKQYTLKDSYSIASVIKVLLNKIDPSIKHEATAEYSRFLYDETVPISMNRFYVYITQKTNILKGEYDQPAQKAEISFEEVMKMLRDCFRCYWFIEDGKLKIEHISFFIKGGSYSYSSNVQLDFTKLTDQFNKKHSSYFQSEVEYDKSDLNQRYEFNWMDDVTDLFGGLTIDVKSNYIQKDKNEEINISQFSSDVDYMLFNPSNFSDDGFALLCPANIRIELSNYIDNTYLTPSGGKQAYDGYVIRIYAISPGMKYRLKGQNIKAGSGTNISVCTTSDRSADSIKRIILRTSANTDVDIEITAQNGENYIAICTRYAIDNPIIATTKDPELPIVETQLIDENGDSYKAVIQNFYASWAYLAHFYMYDMPARSIECNVTELYVNAIKMCMKHTIEFPTEEDLDELKLIKTNIGNGKVDEISVNINTRHTKVRLLYEPQ